MHLMNKMILPKKRKIDAFKHTFSVVFFAVFSLLGSCEIKNEERNSTKVEHSLDSLSLSTSVHKAGVESSETAHNKKRDILTKKKCESIMEFSYKNLRGRLFDSLNNSAKLIELEDKSICCEGLRKKNGEGCDTILLSQKFNLRFVRRFAASLEDETNPCTNRGDVLLFRNKKFYLMSDVFDKYAVYQKVADPFLEFEEAKIWQSEKDTFLVLQAREIRMLPKFYTYWVVFHVTQKSIKVFGFFDSSYGDWDCFGITEKNNYFSYIGRSCYEEQAHLYFFKENNFIKTEYFLSLIIESEFKWDNFKVNCKKSRWFCELEE